MENDLKIYNIILLAVSPDFALKKMNTCDATHIGHKYIMS